MVIDPGSLLLRLTRRISCLPAAFGSVIARQKCCLPGPSIYVTRNMTHASFCCDYQLYLLKAPPSVSSSGFYLSHTPHSRALCLLLLLSLYGFDNNQKEKETELCFSKGKCQLLNRLVSVLFCCSGDVGDFFSPELQFCIL